MPRFHNRIYLWAGRSSRSGAALSHALGIQRIRPHNSRWNPNLGDLIINWGSTNIPIRHFENLQIACRYINLPCKVSIAVDKTLSFALMKEEGVSIPAFTNSIDQAISWIDDEGSTVVARTLSRSSGGRGIKIITEENWRNGVDIPPAPLYTKYIKKNAEYRVHISRNKIFYVQKKLRRLETPNEDVNWQVRNHGNGFIFGIVQTSDLPRDVEFKAYQAMDALRLDFGAVDIIETASKKAYVLELNTAPALEGRSIEIYARKFMEDYFAI